MKLFKFTRTRICLSVGNFFIKLKFIPWNSRQSISFVPKELGSWLNAYQMASYPTQYFSGTYGFFQITITDFFRTAKVPHDVEHKSSLIQALFKAYKSYDLKLKEISWRELFDKSCLEIISQNNSEILEMCESVFNGKLYKDTGLHGDLNPNNLLRMGEKNILIDWENSRNKGDFIWDIYWYYAILFRSCSKAGFDVKHLLSMETDFIADRHELCIIYSGMKWHLDIERHRKGKDVALDDLLIRLQTIYKSYRTIYVT